MGRPVYQYFTSVDGHTDRCLIGVDVPLPDPVEEAMRQVADALEAQVFGVDPESRVRALRRSILGDAAAPEPGPTGLLAALDAGERY